jgi:hypothetical protein
MPCNHPKARFLPCSAADRFPGCWFCDDCEETFTFDPNNPPPEGIQYLPEPNKDLTKGPLVLPKYSGKG